MPVPFLLALSLFFLFSATSLANDLTQKQGPETQKSNPTSKIRALHISLEPAKQVTPEIAKRLIETAQKNGFNTLIILLTNNVAFKAIPNFSQDKSWSTVEFLAVVENARQHGLAVIPEIKLLTHQEKSFLNSYPNLMFNRVSYDPRKNEVYKVVYALLDELIALIHPTAIHIGHDEVVGWNKKHAEKILGVDEAALPANLFLQDTLQIHAYLKLKGIETWMWGDMLVSPNEFQFPLIQESELHGSLTGYGKAIRDKLPKDIVICDWHYFDKQSAFPSLAIFKKEGFRVLGATWKKPETTYNFSHYAASQNADGMIATTWYHVPRQDWDILDSIIKVSGDAFKTDFPDAK